MIHLEKIVTWIIAIVIFGLLIMYFFSPGEGVFEKANNVVNSVKEYLPVIGIGAKELTAEKPVIPEEHRKEIQMLNETIRKMLNSNKKNCFANYGGFSDLGEEGTSLILSHDPVADETRIRVYGGAGGKQVITDLIIDIKGMKPCVIAGSDEVAENFKSMFVDKNSVSGSYFNSVQSIQIYYETEKGIGMAKGLACSNGNRILVPEFGIGSRQGPNTYCNNLEDVGWLFTPNNRHICFFPTNYASSADRHGLNNDIVADFGKMERCY